MTRRSFREPETTHTPGDLLFIRFSEVLANRERAEMELVGWVISDPAKMLSVAVAAGVERGHLWHDTPQEIWDAIDIAGMYGTEAVLRLLERFWRAERRWDDIGGLPRDIAGITYYADAWNAWRLSRLPMSSPPVAPHIVTHYARRLLEVDRRICRANGCVREAVQLLGGGAAEFELAIREAMRVKARAETEGGARAGERPALPRDRDLAGGRGGRGGAAVAGAGSGLGGHRAAGPRSDARVGTRPGPMPALAGGTTGNDRAIPVTQRRQMPKEVA
jgi:hypothetical protein